MAFLDSSSSIILDAVITQEGRRLLARGDGSFKPVKFAVFDTEINYGNFNKSHASGSAYYDLEILQTPVLEAFTDSDSYSSSKLISIPRTNLLFLPVVKMNDLQSNSARNGTSNSFLIASDKDTETQLASSGGVLFGERPANANQIIRVDQGLDTDDLSPSLSIDPDLNETQYIIEMDSRLGALVSPVDHRRAAVSYIDNDYISSVYVTLSDSDFVAENEDDSDNLQVIAGPRGTILQFKVQSSLEINTSQYLFDTVGVVGAGTWAGYKYIDSNIRVSGGATGASISIPVRFIKYTG